MGARWGVGRRMTAQEYARTPLAPLGWLGRRQETGGEDPPEGAWPDDPPVEDEIEDRWAA